MPSGIYKKTIKHKKNIGIAIKKAHIGRPLFGIKTKKYCIVNKCNDKHYSLGYCQKHYHKFKKWGNPLEPQHRNYGKKGSKNSNWNGGTSEYPNHYLMKKNRLIVLNKYPICQKCKKNKSTEIHHKDDSKTNHSLNNLQALCRSCHQKTFSKIRKNKYTLIYGMNLSQIAKKLGFRSVVSVWNLHKQNKLNLFIGKHNE